MQKAKSYTSPFGKAVYPYLSKCDVRYKPEGEFKVDLELSTDDAQETINIINRMLDKSVAEAQEKTGKKNIKKASLPFKDEDGKTILKFKMKASGTNAKTGESFKQRPSLFDNELNPINPSDVTIWGGSILRVNYVPFTWYTPALGAGVSLRLKSVQVKDLISGDSQMGNPKDMGFEKVEGDASSKNQQEVGNEEEPMASETDF